MVSYGFLYYGFLYMVSCKLSLAVEDGIYIRDFPRPMSGSAPIPTGGRADFMVRCGTQAAVTWGQDTIATATRQFQWSFHVISIPFQWSFSVINHCVSTNAMTTEKE